MIYYTTSIQTSKLYIYVCIQYIRPMFERMETLESIPILVHTCAAFSATPQHLCVDAQRFHETGQFLSIQCSLMPLTHGCQGPPGETSNGPKSPGMWMVILSMYVCLSVRPSVCMYVCVSCVCVWTIWKDVKLLLPFLLVHFKQGISFHSKQGHAASLTYRVQRSYGLGWDIRADHPDVPALSFQFSAMGRG